MSTSAPPDLSPEDRLVHEAALLGARLARAVRRRKPAQVAQLLAEGHTLGVDALLVALAGMVPAYRTPAELLAWTVDAAVEPPARPPADHGTDAGYGEHRRNGTPACRPCLIAHSVTSRPKACREEFLRLVAAGVDHATSAELSRASVVLSSPSRSEHAA